MEDSSIPAYGLLASGIIGVLYALVYVVWSLGALLLSLGSSLAMFGYSDFLEALMYVVMLNLVPFFQFLAFFVTGLMSAITAFAGFRLLSHQSKGVVWLGIVCSPLAPLLALVVNFGSVFKAGGIVSCVTGCLVGNIPTVIVLLIGIVAAGLGGYYMMLPEAQERWV